MATTWLGQSALLNVAMARNRNTHVPAAMIQAARRAKVGAGRSVNDPVESIDAVRAMACKIGQMAVSSPKLAIIFEVGPVPPRWWLCVGWPRDWLVKWF